MRNVMMHPDSKIYNFPKSPMGPTSTLSKYLDYVYLLGDPHLGKKFTTGVPLHRRGDREQMQREQFEDEVIGLKPGRHFHVCMGDLFDKFTVANHWVEFAYQTYRQASIQNPSIQYIVLQGNHDASRDKSLISSFQIFAELCKNLPNVRVLTKHPIFEKYDGLNFLFVPWVPFQTTEELLHLEFQVLGKARHTPFCAFGHWDKESHGEDVSANLIPFEMFDDCCDGVITGHYHKPERIVKKNMEVFITGSMQPYAHGEERSDNPDPMYQTHSRQFVLDCLEQDKNYFENKVLRIALEENEPPLADINCFALTHTRSKNLDDEDADLDVDVDSFNLQQLFHSIMGDKGVPEELTRELWEQL